MSFLTRNHRWAEIGALVWALGRGPTGSRPPEDRGDRDWVLRALRGPNGHHGACRSSPARGHPELAPEPLEQFHADGRRLSDPVTGHGFVI